ncbi:hypothetical protein EJB05_14575, partial [Eragrostis curvula]
MGQVQTLYQTLGHPLYIYGSLPHVLLALQTPPTPSGCRHASPPSRPAAQSHIGINVSGDPSIQMQPNFASRVLYNRSKIQVKI